MTASRLEMDPPLSTPTRQTFDKGNNHILAGDTTKEVPPTSSKLPSDGIMEEFVSQMTTMLLNILEHHGRANQHLASLEEDLAHTKLEEEKLKATIEALEKEKSKMNARVALMDRKDLKEIPTLNLEEFEKCLVDYRNPTTLDDAQASPNFEDLRTNQRVRLRAEVRNLGAEPQWLTRSTCIRLEYEPTILPDVAPADNPTRPVTLDLTVDAREDPSSLPQSQIVPVPTFVDLTQYTSSLENEGLEDQGWPCKEDLTKEDLEFAMYKGCYLRRDVINMYINEAFLKKPRE
ncbi:hypothetical protein R1flu_008127 [Riccia fluitans]|uniref:Uncharacterized protein n=1 Tax=Riccia fluitans TaxID=41844 RepID=A0ABD1YEC3_9MARC